MDCGYQLAREEEEKKNRFVGYIPIPNLSYLYLFVLPIPVPCWIHQVWIHGSCRRHGSPTIIAGSSGNWPPWRSPTLNTLEEGKLLYMTLRPKASLRILIVCINWKALWNIAKWSCPRQYIYMSIHWTLKIWCILLMNLYSARLVRASHWQMIATYMHWGPCISKYMVFSFVLMSN